MGRVASQAVERAGPFSLFITLAEGEGCGLKPDGGCVSFLSHFTPLSAVAFSAHLHSLRSATAGVSAEPADRFVRKLVFYGGDVISGRPVAAFAADTPVDRFRAFLVQNRKSVGCVTTDTKPEHVGRLQYA